MSGMPLYLYHCASCGKEHELLQRFSDPPLTKCPSCGGKVEKKITSTGFQLKGGGWYKDGYATPKPEKKSEGEAKPGDSKTGEKKEQKKADPLKKKED